MKNEYTSFLAFFSILNFFCTLFKKSPNTGIECGFEHSISIGARPFFFIAVVLRLIIGLLS